MEGRPDVVALPSSLVTWIGAVVRAQPHRPALIDERETLTYQQLWDRSAVVARGLLAQGLRPGQTVGLIGANECAFIVNYFGVMRAGANAVPLNNRLDATAITEQLRHVDAFAVIVGDISAEISAQVAESFRVLPMIEPDRPSSSGRLPAVGANSPCAIMMTSGSTGRPKGVVHSQGTMLHAAVQLATTFPYGPETRGLVFLPLYACIPEQVLPTLCTGGCLEILPGFDIDRVADACTRATMFDAVPTILSRLLEHAPLAKLAHLQWILFASEMMPVALLRRWWEELPGVEAHQLYGMTEALPLTAASHRMLRRSPTTVGRPFATTNITVLPGAQSGSQADSGGEILASTPARMRNYYEDPAATKAALTANGALRTGDLGQIDEHGLLHLTGRSKDVIISGGINIVPAEIESVVARHPAVARVVVVGVPSERWGETPVVVAVARRGEDLTAEAILGYCRSNLPGYKRPSAAAVVESLPVTGIGKTAKEAVKKMVIDERLGLVSV